MHIVLTNDDGIDAPGLAALERGLLGLGALRVAAPASAQSGVGHRVTTREPIAVRENAPERFTIDGTPADCVRLALKKLFQEVDWVIAGINPGANLGSDVYQSGTVAAAREAAILGRCAIAVSQYVARDSAIDWELTALCARAVIRQLMALPLDPGFFWNVNLPSPLYPEVIPEVVFCGLDTSPHRFDFRQRNGGYLYEGTIHDRPREPGKDVDVCFGGQVAVTRIALRTARFFPGPESR